MDYSNNKVYNKNIIANTLPVKSHHVIPVE